MIFLKKPKPMFLGHFWPFLVIFARWGIFPKNLALSHTNIYIDPQHHAKFQRKLMRQLRENLRTDGRTDGRTDRTYFIGPFWPRPRTQKLIKSIENKWIRNNWEGAKCNVLGVPHTTRVFNMACVGTWESDHTPFPSRPDIVSSNHPKVTWIIERSCK